MHCFLVRTTLAALLVTGLAMPGLAQQKGKKKGLQGPAAQVFAVPANIELTEEQKTKLEELKKSHGDKAAEIGKKLNDLLTAEQKAARKAAQEKAKADGTKGKEMREAIAAAVNLTPEQKEQQAKLQKELQTLKTEVMSKVLTEEQLAKLKGAGKKPGKKNNPS